MRKGLVDVLAVKGYQVDVAERGDEGLALARAGAYQLILLDVMLPGMSGFDVLKALRAEGLMTPVLMLTAQNTELDKVLGFELGVDDYVTKPFSLLELLGRIGALLRRGAPAGEPAGGPAEGPPEALRFGPVTLDLRRYQASRDGQPIELPAKAFDVLGALARRKGEVVSRDDLIDEVWGKDEFINQRTVNNLVVRLRQAIEPDAEAPRYLKTVHGVGYRLDA
jgi:DNA-binding response OmpR family regulator